jgi:methylphosphotriester-DNA--protein-cysteine methyltransferase
MTSSFAALDRATCDRARLARDPAYDGLFFTGVRTTRIYCRPICPVRPAKSRNVVFFPTAAAAERAGFRPCLRCRPETAPGSPAWNGTATTVARGMRLIDEGFLDCGSVQALAETLGIGPRHLLRLFLRHAGATPRSPSRRASAACAGSTTPSGRPTAEHRPPCAGRRGPPLLHGHPDVHASCRYITTARTA